MGAAGRISRCVSTPACLCELRNQASFYPFPKGHRQHFTASQRDGDSQSYKRLKVIEDEEALPFILKSVY